jgi:hypothetical protein
VTTIGIQENTFDVLANHCFCLCSAAVTLLLLLMLCCTSAHRILVQLQSGTAVDSNCEPLKALLLPASVALLLVCYHRQLLLVLLSYHLYSQHADLCQL